MDFKARLGRTLQSPAYRKSRRILRGLDTRAFGSPEVGSGGSEIRVPPSPFLDSFRIVDHSPNTGMTP